MSRELDLVAQRVLQRLEPGQANAVSARDLAAGLGVSSRTIRMAVDRLVKVHKQPIASSTEPPYGYWLLATEEERQRYEAQLLSRLKELQERVRIVHRVQLVPPVATGQMRLI